jgi:hypothetical protein
MLLEYCRIEQIRTSERMHRWHAAKSPPFLSVQKWRVVGKQACQWQQQQQQLQQQQQQQQQGTDPWSVGMHTARMINSCV